MNIIYERVAPIDLKDRVRESQELRSGFSTFYYSCIHSWELPQIDLFSSNQLKSITLQNATV